MASKAVTAIGSLAASIADAVGRWDRRRDDRAVDRLIARSGGRLTDAVEFEIASRVTRSGF